MKQIKLKDLLLKEGNDMGAEDVGLTASPSGRVWEAGNESIGVLDAITSDDFKQFAVQTKKMLDAWGNVVKYNKTNPDAASEFLNHIFHSLSEIEAKAKEAKDKISPYLS